MTVVLGYPQTGKQPSPSPRYPKREAEDNAGRKPCKGSPEGTFGTQLLGQIQNLENALQEVKDSQTNAVQWAALMADYVGIRELTAENLNLLVERIEVFDRTETDGEAEQVIRICYRFGGYIGERRFKAKVLRNTGGWERRRRKERKDDGKISFVS